MSNHSARADHTTGRINPRKPQLATRAVHEEGWAFVTANHFWAAPAPRTPATITPTWVSARTAVFRAVKYSMVASNEKRRERGTDRYPTRWRRRSQAKWRMLGTKPLHSNMPTGGPPCSE